MEITPDEMRLMLYILSAFIDSLDAPEKAEAEALLDRIQQERKL